MPKSQKPSSNGYSSSSGEEDGDAAWRAAINSVAGTTTYISSLTNGSSATKQNHHHDNNGSINPKNKELKHYQIKAQKLLEDILEKSIEIVKEPVPVLDEVPKIDDDACCIRLFKHSQPGIILDPIDEPQPPRKRPRILPGEDIDDKSKKFRTRIRSVAVDGKDLMAAANDAYKKSLARIEAKDAAAKAAAKREEERVNNLKKIKGERWLPSMAKEMQVKSQLKVMQFRRRIRSVAVDGESLMAAANDAYKKSLARIEAKDAAAKAASKREEERVKNLKNIRGERWLPSMAKKMQVKSQQ